MVPAFGSPRQSSCGCAGRPSGPMWYMTGHIPRTSRPVYGNQTGISHFASVCSSTNAYYCAASNRPLICNVLLDLPWILTRLMVAYLCETATLRVTISTDLARPCTHQPQQFAPASSTSSRRHYAKKRPWPYEESLSKFRTSYLQKVVEILSYPLISFVGDRV